MDRAEKIKAGMARSRARKMAKVLLDCGVCYQEGATTFFATVCSRPEHSAFAVRLSATPTDTEVLDWLIANVLEARYNSRDKIVEAMKEL